MRIVYNLKNIKVGYAGKSPGLVLGPRLKATGQSRPEKYFAGQARLGRKTVGLSRPVPCLSLPIPALNPPQDGSFSLEKI